MIFLSQGHLLTEKVRKVLKDFVHKTEGGVLTYAYSTAFQNLLTDIETAKKVIKTDRQKLLFCVGLPSSVWWIKDEGSF